MSKVLITGISGFIGYHLAKQLVERGDRVTGLVRSTSSTTLLDTLDVELVHGDIADLGSLQRGFKGHSTVFHLAGLTKARHKEDFRRVNEIGTGNVAHACALMATPPQMLHVSSLAAIGPTVNGIAPTENAIAVPVSHYGRSKWKGEQAVRPFADQIPITIVRPPIVFGEADRAFLNIVKPIHRFGVHPVAGFLPKSFSVIHAADLSALIIAAAKDGERLPSDPSNPENNESGQGIYFAEAERRFTYRELGSEVGRALKRETRILRIPHAAVWLWAGLAELTTRFGAVPALNLDKVREATAGSWICSAEKANGQLGFATQKTVRKRLSETVLWYIEHGWL